MSFPLTYFNELVAIIDGRVVASVGNLPITELTIDSRSKTITDFPIFFALVGVNHNGHAYVAEAYQKGIRQFVVDQHHPIAILEKAHDVNIVQVAHTHHALQQFAALYRAQYQLPILGIVGSHGKTTVKEWMHLLLSSKYKTISNPHSYNSQVGVPLAVSLLRPSHGYAIFEAAISTVGEMEKLYPIIQPTHGLFTNIGPTHSQGFQDERQKIAEKVVLFASCHKIYYCADHQNIHEILQQRYAHSKQLVCWSCSRPEAQYVVTAKLVEDQTQLQIATAYASYHFIVPLLDYASIENITHCLVYLLDSGFDSALLQRLLSQLQSLPMRMALKTGIRQCKIIDDTYINDPVSLKLALDFMQQQHKTKQTVILSDLLQSNKPDAALYQEVALLCKHYPIHRLIGIGPKIFRHKDLFNLPQAVFFNSVEDCMQQLPSFNDEVILIKGARSFQLERIVQHLEKNIHTTVLALDLKALYHNICYFRSKLNPTTKIMAMVKASAYGNRNDIFVVTLQRHGIDYLGVACVDEGVQLRRQGITIPIMVIHASPEQFELMLHYQLEPVVYSLMVLAEWRSFIAATQYIYAIPIHLKLETGMHRLGIEEEEIDSLIIQLKQLPRLQVVSIFSHLVAAQSPDHDSYTYLQAERFMRMAQHIEDQLALQVIKHLLNSNGTLRFPSFQFDMVRLGIGLHGVGIASTGSYPLIAVGKLTTTVAQVKSIPKGATIGYNQQAVAVQAMTIAVMPIGYADGIHTTFGLGKGGVVIQDRYCPIIGEVCMDMIIVDVTGMHVKRGDEVVIFSAQYPIDVLAQQVGSIAYELLTQISPRVKRVYYA